MHSLATSFPGSVVMLLGVAVIVVGLGWRFASSVLSARKVRARLADPRADVRRTAVAVATSGGIARHAARLLDIARRDPDRSVRDAVADAVKRNMWEPIDNPKVLELRMWAEGRRAGTKRRDGERVLVTGAGGPAGVSVIRALKAARHTVIAVDVDPLGAGLYLADETDIVPPVDDPAFVDGVLDIAERHGATALMPTLTEELCVLAPRTEEVEAVVPAWISSFDSLETCRDKWLFASAMRDAGVNIPATGLGSADGVPGPWIVKPRCDRGSRGVVAVDRGDDLPAVIAATDGPIVQTRLGGCEFTVDVLVSRDGELVGAVPRWRLETKAGISTKGRTFCDDGVLLGVASVVGVLGLHGPANVQGFMTDAGPCFIECNPRFSGGLPLSLASGADLVGEYLRGILGRPLRPERLAYREGTTMIRHFEEIYA